MGRGGGDMKDEWAGRGGGGCVMKDEWAGRGGGVNF